MEATPFITDYNTLLEWAQPIKLVPGWKTHQMTVLVDGFSDVPGELQSILQIPTKFIPPEARFVRERHREPVAGNTRVFRLL